MARALLDRIRLAAILRLETLDDRTRIDPRLRDVERVGADAGVLLARIGDGAADDLLDHPTGALLAEAEHGDRVIHVAPADQIHQQPRLPRADAGEAMFG